MGLLQMSFSGAVIILAIMIIRAILIHKLPKNTFLVLWGIALLRLLVPFSFPSVFSVYTAAERIMPAGTTLFPSGEYRWLPVKITESDGIQGNAVLPEEESPESYSEKSSEDGSASESISLWEIVWTVGVIFCTVFFVITYMLCLRRFKMSLPADTAVLERWQEKHNLRRKISIRQSEFISTPLTYGVIHPVILMPKVFRWSDTGHLRYILEHEYVHIQRCDALTKLVLIAAVCVHWFNPLVWMMYILCNRDIELSCDETVVQRFGEYEKAAYALTLIEMEETKSSLIPFCNSFSKNAAEERITAIMKIKKISRRTCAAAAALVLCVAGGFATSAAAAEEKEVNMATEIPELVIDDVTAQASDTENNATENSDTVSKDMEVEEPETVLKDTDIEKTETASENMETEEPETALEDMVIEESGAAVGNIQVEVPETVLENVDLEYSGMNEEMPAEEVNVEVSDLSNAQVVYNSER